MSDLISRQEVKEILRTEWVKLFPMELDPYLSLAMEKIENIPSTKPKTGKWTIETIGEIPRMDSPIYEPIYKCSCCGMPTESYVRFEKPIMPEDADFPRYCPDCGASMAVTEMNEEMKKLRDYLDTEGIPWEDYSQGGDYPIERTRFYINGCEWSVIHGFGTYGGYSTFERDKGLLELMAGDINGGEPVGWLTAEQVLKKVGVTESEDKE